MSFAGGLFRNSSSLYKHNNAIDYAHYGLLLILNSYSASHINLCTWTLLNIVVTAQWEGMGDVGSARYEPALLPPRPTIRVLSYGNCQRSTHSICK